MALDVERTIGFQNFEDGGLKVHSVVVNELEAVGDEITSLGHSILHAECHDSLVVGFDLLEAPKDVGRNLGLGELAHSVEAVVTKDWHDSWNHFADNASQTAVRNPVVENLVVEEKLRDDEISPGINLFLQVTDVVFAGGRLQMYLGVAGHSDAEEVTIFLFYEFDKVGGVVKAIFCGHPIGRTTGWVTTKSE